MSNISRHAESEFCGYVYFDTPDWWHDFHITKACAQAIQEFHQAVMALNSEDGENEVVLHELWEKSERVVNHMRWHTKENIAVIIALAGLYKECVDRTTPMNFYAQFTHRSLSIKAETIRSFLSTRHGVYR